LLVVVFGFGEEGGGDSVCGPGSGSVVTAEWAKLRPTKDLTQRARRLNTKNRAQRTENTEHRDTEKRKDSASFEAQSKEAQSALSFAEKVPGSIERSGSFPSLKTND
jgi:hypothetical protein